MKEKTSKAFKYLIAYGMWFADIGLSAWLLFLSRTTLLAYLALFHDPEDYFSPKRAVVIDRVFTIMFGIGWLALIVITEEYYRAGAIKDGLMKRFARVTGPIFLCIFIADFLLIGTQGIDGAGWLRWLILLAELVIGLLLVVYSKKKDVDKST
jgi:hypothetical protein